MSDDDQLQNLKYQNERLKQAVGRLISVSGLDGRPVSIKKVKEAVEFAKKMLRPRKLSKDKELNLD